MTINQVQEAMDCGRTVTYGRLARCLEGELIERTSIPGVSTPVLHCTRAGLRYVGLGLPVASVSVASVVHQLRCAEVGIQIEKKLGPNRLLTEREIVLEEQIEGQPVASVTVGYFRGQPRMHRADLAALAKKGTIAVEVELTPKSPARLRGIIEAWASEVRGGGLVAVHYLCEPGQTYRAVERAIRSAGAEKAIVLDEVPG